MRKTNEAEIAREARLMTRKEVVLKAINKQINWIQAADILGITARHMRRLKRRYEESGYGGLRDCRSGRPRRKRIALKTIRELCRLKKELYPDCSLRHFHEYARERHGLGISYTWARIVLEEAGIVEKAPGRGKYRRKRERRPMIGMLLHLDGSTHEWIQGLPPRDLIVMLDDTDGRILICPVLPAGRNDLHTGRSGACPDPLRALLRAVSRSREPFWQDLLCGSRP